MFNQRPMDTCHALPTYDSNKYSYIHAHICVCTCIILAAYRKTHLISTPW